DEHAFVVWLGGFEQDGAGAIAKDDTGGAVLIIDDGGHHVSANGEYFLMSASANELRGDLKCVYESGTGGGDVESPSAFASHFVLDEACGRRKQHVRGDGGDHDGLDLSGSDAA